MQLAEAKMEGKADYTNAQIISTHQTGVSEVLQSLLAQATETPLPAELGVATELWKVQPDTLGEEKKRVTSESENSWKEVFPYIPSSVQDMPHRNGVTITNCLSLLPYPHTYSPTYLLRNSSYPSDKAVTSIPSCQAGKKKPAFLIMSVSSQKLNCPPRSTGLGQTSETCGTNAFV